MIFGTKKRSLRISALSRGSSSLIASSRRSHRQTMGPNRLPLIHRTSTIKRISSSGISEVSGLSSLHIGEQELLESDASVTVGVGESKVIGRFVHEPTQLREPRRHTATEFEKAGKRDLRVVRTRDATEYLASVVDLISGEALVCALAIQRHWSIVVAW